MSRAGFVLAGGNSTRMGRDKALLPFRGGALAAHVAAAVATAAGSVTLIGDPVKYGHLGYTVLPDGTPGAGPLGGIETALSRTFADWNLVLACDMPAVPAEFLRDLLDAAERLDAAVLVPAGPSGRPEPLTAVYHRRCAGHLRRALDAGVRKVMDALAGLDVRIQTVDDGAWFENLNTPGEWAGYRHDGR
ncbi:MAG TPA: molybdenum cofactor guanylyltransferase [Bryobacteraceae bacterium]|nr:molybdenum cofactor guanylyltransferase [Bryobacteraceae bacterium]